MKERLMVMLGNILMGFGTIFLLCAVYFLLRQIKKLKSQRKLPDICRKCTNSTNSGFVCTLGLKPKIWLRGLLFKEVVEECEKFKEKLSTKEVKKRYGQFKPELYNRE